MESNGHVKLHIKKIAPGILALSFIGLLILTVCKPKIKPVQMSAPVKGIIIGSNGQPVAKAVVMIEKSPGGHTDIASVSNAQGEFELNDMDEPGKYVLMINDNGNLQHKEVVLQAKDSVINIKL
jgi:Carboxypeptidase regulatory-like domain